MKIKTVATVDGINSVDFGANAPRFYWFKNLSDSTLYVSSNPNMITGGDDVSELPPKASTAIETTAGVVYILGAGKIEIHNTDSKFCPFRGTAVVSGGGDSMKGTSISASISGEVGQEITACLYSYEDQVMQVTASEDIVIYDSEVQLISGMNQVTIGYFRKGGSGNGVINLKTGSDIVLLEYKILDSLFSQYNFVTETANETLFIYGGRTVTKLTNDKAYCAYSHGGEYFTPWIVGLTNDSTKYSMAGTESSALSPQYGQGGTYERYGKTWYYNFSNPNSMTGYLMDTSGANRYYMGANTTLEDMIKKIIDICRPDFM